GPHRRHAITKRHRIAETNDPKRPRGLPPDRVISTKVLRVRRNTSEVPVNMVQVRLQAPQQQRIAFEDRRLLRARDLHLLLRRVYKQIETVGTRHREARDDLDRQQEQQENDVDKSEVQQSSPERDLI